MTTIPQSAKHKLSSLQLAEELDNTQEISTDALYG